MPRPLDEPIPAAEWLYRALRPDDVAGGVVLPQSLELRPACSVDRDKYIGDDPRSVLEQVDGANGIAVVQPQHLPRSMTPPAPNQRTFRFEAGDDPLAENEAHSEIRLCVEPGAYNRNLRIRNAVTLLSLQEALARTLRVVMSR
jgi:hypothetical protein